MLKQKPSTTTGSKINGQHAEQLICDYRRSGLTQKEFSRKSQISLSTLQYYLYRKTNQKGKNLNGSSPPRFQEISMVQAFPAERWEAQLVMNQSLHLKFKEGTDPLWVAKIAKEVFKSCGA